MKKSVFEIKKSADKQFYFVLKALNNEVIGTSETYKTKQNCQTGIASVVNNCTEVERFQVKESADNKLYFVLKSRNGRTILVSETYESKAGCENGMWSVTENALEAEIIDTTKRKKNDNI